MGLGKRNKEGGAGGAGGSDQARLLLMVEVAAGAAEGAAVGVLRIHVALVAWLSQFSSQLPLSEQLRLAETPGRCTGVRQEAEQQAVV